MLGGPQSRRLGVYSLKRGRLSVVAPLGGAGDPWYSRGSLGALWITPTKRKRDRRQRCGYVCVQSSQLARGVRKRRRPTGRVLCATARRVWCLPEEFVALRARACVCVCVGVLRSCCTLLPSHLADITREPHSSSVWGCVDALVSSGGKRRKSEARHATKPKSCGLLGEGKSCHLPAWGASE